MGGDTYLDKQIAEGEAQDPPAPVTTPEPPVAPQETSEPTPPTPQP